MKKENLILSRSFEFAVSIVLLYKRMVSEREFILAEQLLKSGTSIGANTEEATGAYSKKDFIQK